MGTTTCTHQEKIETVGNGIQYGTCRICGQVRRYNTLDLREKPKIIKLGKVNGAIVLPGTKDTPELPTQEAAELEAARKEPVTVEQKTEDSTVAGEEQPETYVGKPHKYQRGSRKWRTRCKSCEFGYFHDEVFWCSSKRCPQWCPPRLRPQYRLKVEAKAVKKPKEPPVTPRAAPETVEAAEEVCASCPVVQAFKGYRMAVNDILVTLKRRKGGF